MTEGNSGITPSFLARFSWLSLLWQFVATLVCVTAFFWLITLIPEETAGYLLFGILLLLWVPVVLVLVLVPALLALWRPRILVMIVLAVMLLAIVQRVLLGIEANEVAALDQRQMLPAQGRHDVVLSGWLSPDCANLCMEVLAKSGYRYFAQSMGHQWTVWELRRGPSCADPDTRESYIDFLAAGFTGMCAVRSTRPAGQDAVSIEFGRAEPSFKGSNCEVVEIRNGERRLLARWLSGSVYPLSYWFELLGVHEVMVGEPFQEHELYAAALDAPLVGGDYPGGATLDAVLDSLVSLPPDPSLQWKVLTAYRTLAELNRESNHDILFAQVTQLLNGSQPNHIVAGFSLLQYLPPTDVQLAQPRIVALLGDRDPDVVAAALGAAFRFPMEDRRALQATFTALAESSALISPVSPALEPLLGHFLKIGVFPASDREHAKTLLTTRDDLSGPQRVALLSIIAYGGPAMRAEASQIVLTMKDQALFELVIAMKNVRWPDLSGQQRDDWTDGEKTRLVEHLDRVPPAQLAQYLTVLRSSDVLAKHAGAVVPVLRQRLAEAQAETPRDEQRIKDLESLKYLLDR